MSVMNGSVSFSSNSLTSAVGTVFVEKAIAVPARSWIY